MSGSGVLDLVLVLALALYAVSGYRHGLTASAFSLGGLLAGGALGMWTLPPLVRQFGVDGHELGRIAFLVVGVLLLASIGHTIGYALGRKVRRLVRVGPLRWADSVLGAVASVVVVSFCLWFVAGAALGTAFGPTARLIGGSQVLQAIDKAVPADAGRAFSGFSEALDRHGFPRVFEGLQREPITAVAPPQAGTTRGPGVANAASSIVRITGNSRSCHRGQEGSGWVVAPQRVVTNAHVVAGMDRVAVQVGGAGPNLIGEVVVFDPQRDLAVVAVPGLRAAPLREGRPMSTSEGAVIAGFPLDGPYRVDAARVRSVITARGEDIYGGSGVTRQVYSLAGRVQPGNSGGPLLSTRGTVVGTIFARSIEDPNTGYALTLEESQPVIDLASTAVRPVSTGACVSNLSTS